MIVACAAAVRKSQPEHLRLAGTKERFLGEDILGSLRNLKHHSGMAEAMLN